ncbi:kelch-like protein 17 isoform X2 [Acyrthosiphon pisum]|uniref:Kelch-like protein diablo n=1 Tax=Acyrthosiphon pisum TaxID=7029 RepID=A0A8R2H8D3_ACYPI|nr:kelch-like protein 17 isoform X2 [Acyrthosiphon pisum]|eukprot:XP_016662058.1 PREDICTED: kelch-like protein 17 isoform X2 [Acyrthosiphon pisum]
MSVKEMDTIQASSCANNLKQVLQSNKCEPTNFRNDSHSVRILENLQSLRKNEVLCDIRFETNDGTLVLGHKNVLIAASPYFRAMFSNFDKSNKDLVNIRELDSTILQQLIDYIYTGEIIVTKENVQELLSAANVLQLDYVNEACAEFLQKQLNSSNCFDFKAFADLHNCTDLLSSSEAYIKQHFLEVIKSEDFLSLSSEDLVKFISSNDLAVPFEEKVFECVIKWVKHDLDRRNDFLPNLMEHVRLPLLKPDILFNISEEPLLKNSPKCNDYIIEAFYFNHQKTVQHFTIPKTIRFKPRQFDGFQKVILMFNECDTLPKCHTEWYDPATKQRENAPGINDCRKTAGFCVLSDQFVFVMGGVNGRSSKSVSMLDVSSQSPFWVPMVDMLVSRRRLGVGVLDDSIYAVGGHDGNSALNTVEVFNARTQKWQMVSSMSVKRYNLGVGVLNNSLFAVGGYNGGHLKSVEYYDPTLGTWTSVADMSKNREGAGVGVLDGLMYAFGGYDGKYLKSCEVYKPSDGVWSSIADMHLGRYRPGVVVLDDYLYVMGGKSEESINDTVEMYNPITNTWTMERLSRNGIRIYGGVVVDRPHHYN